MNGTLGIVIILGAFAMNPRDLQGKSGENKERQALLLMVCDKSGAGRTSLQTAKETTTSIFQRSGIDINWIEIASETCVLPTMDHSIAVIIASQSPIDWTSRDAMGFAPGGTGERPRVYIFLNLVKEFVANFRLAGTLDKSVGIILGHAISHEVGHVLIAGDAHTPRGIMSTKWDYNQWRNAIAGTLLFAPEQQAIMRDRLRDKVTIQGH